MKKEMLYCVFKFCFSLSSNTQSGIVLFFTIPDTHENEGNCFGLSIYLFIYAWIIG